MKILSVNVGLPKEVSWQGKLVTTGIFKEPVNTPVMLRALNLDGDQQADLTVHGGVTKAVYAYPSEHYGYWRTELPGVDLPWGMFGENFAPGNPSRGITGKLQRLFSTSAREAAVIPAGYTDITNVRKGRSPVAHTCRITAP